MAMESPHIVADVVEIQEFPHLAQAYNVRGVPKTVLNDTVQFTGAVPEAVFLKQVLEAAGVEDIEENGEEPISDQTTPIG